MVRIFFLIGIISCPFFANSTDVCSIPVLNEVEVTDSVHWQIEILESHNWHGLSSNDFAPCSTAAFSLYTRSQLADSSHARPVKPVFMDTVSGTRGSSVQFIGIITRENLPFVQINPGDTITMLCDICGTHKNIVAVGSIPPNRSIALVNVPYCYMGTSGQGLVTSSQPVYLPDKTPTIGRPNDNIMGNVEGHVLFPDSTGIPNVNAVLSLGPWICPSSDRSLTSANGFFSLQCTAGCSFSMSFLDENMQKRVSNKSVPVTTVQDSTIIMNIVLDDYTSIISSTPKKTAPSGPENIRIFNILKDSQKCGISVLIDNPIESIGTIKIGFCSIHGRLLHKSAIFTKGSGTYSCSWDTRDTNGKFLPAGAYICRLQFGTQAVNKTFVLMR